MKTWQPDQEMVLPRVRGLAWARVFARLLVLVVVLFGGLAVLFLVRLFERPFTGEARPLSAWIPHWACGTALHVLGLGFRSQGQPMTQPGAQVANHGSWIDIYALYRRARVSFVAKSEVAGWPAIGLLSRSVGTVFISRDPKAAVAQRAIFVARLRQGQRLVFFPEGTSTDGTLVLPFKSTLFAAFFEPGLKPHMWIQPVTLRYTAPDGQDPRFYGWFGDMTFAPHLIAVLAAPRHGHVEVIYHPPLRVADFPGRKALAAAAEAAVRAGLSDVSPAERQSAAS